MSFSFSTPKSDAGAGDAKPDATSKPFGQVSFNLGFGAAPAVTTANSTGLNLSTTTSNMTSNSLNLGATSNTSAGNFAFGAAPFATGSAFKLGGTTTATITTSTTTSATAGFSLLGTAKATTLTAPSSTAPAFGFNLGGTSAPTTTTSTTGFSLGGTATLTPLSFSTATTKATTTATITPSISLGGAPKTTMTTGFSISTPASTMAPLTTSAIPATGNLNFGQLVDAINKWTIDLEEQGKLFSNQAKQLNAWDRLLVSNGEKVLSLNTGIERVKQQQQQLDQELDFVVAQQKELEDLITPLEKELNDIPLTDVDRLHTYQLAENMDTQLKQMSEDLKEIIEQLNESNKTQESSNPISQIRKILNAHMDSLQWIDRHTSKITGSLDQISKIHDLHRKSHEHSLKKTYD